MFVLSYWMIRFAQHADQQVQNAFIEVPVMRNMIVIFIVIMHIVMVVLMLTGILSVDEALSGFGSPVVILVAALLVVGEMLDRTGVAAGIGDWILAKGGGSETRLYIVIMAATGVLGTSAAILTETPLRAKCG